jgi:SAM-dependent methyltransferase
MDNNTLSKCVKRVYAMYNEADRLPETNGYFSLALRPAACQAIVELLDLTPGSRVFWGGCGTGQEVISIALAYPDVQFVAVDMNLDAISVAKRKIAEIGGSLSNLVVRLSNMMNEPRNNYSHVYSTAVVGSHLYAHLRWLASGRILCMFKSPMWEGEKGGNVRTVKLSGSGGQKQLLANFLE